MNFDMKAVQKVVGNISFEQLKDVDSFVSDNISLFIPSTGPCKYAITEDHSHPGYSFILLFDNNCKIIINGEKIDTKPGLIFAFSPGVIHHEIQTNEFTRYIAIMIEKDFFEVQINDYNLDRLEILNGDFFKPTNELRTYLKDFMIEYKNQLPGYKKILKSLSLTIAHSLIRLILNCDSKKQEIGARFDVNNIIEYMYSNYNKKLSVDDLSEYISLSPSHFSRLFKKETGKSPLDYLIQIRLEKAKKLLLESNKSITDVAYDTGFNSSSHFASSFAKYFKKTPSDYKKGFLK